MVTCHKSEVRVHSFLQEYLTSFRASILNFSDFEPRIKLIILK